LPSNLRTLSGVPGESVTMKRSAAATGAASASHATTSSEASPDKASTQSLAAGWSACLLQSEFRRPRHFGLELRPPRRYLTGKPHFRFAPDCFGQMRPKRCHDSHAHSPCGRPNSRSKSSGWSVIPRIYPPPHRLILFSEPGRPRLHVRLQSRASELRNRLSYNRSGARHR
jgi:hypothetical protein